MTASVEWHTVPIRTLYEGLYDGPHATPKPAESGPVFLGIKNITEDGKLDLSSVRHIADEDYDEWTRRVVPRPGDIVFVYEATLNRYAIIPEDFRGCLGRRIALIRPNPRVVDVRFLFYYFFTPAWRAIIARNTWSGATVDRIPLINFPDFPVRVPPLSEQTRIAGVLAAYDALLENNLRRMQILEEMARALYRDWFIELRAGGTPVSVQDDVPAGWQFVRLAGIADVNRAQINMKAPPERVLYIDISSVGPGIVREVSDLAFAEAPGRARRIVQHGDILWSCVRPNRRSHALVLNPEPDTVASTGFAVLTATKVPFTFLYQATTTDAFVAYLTNHATGAAYPAVTAKTFEDAEILLPPADLLERFAQVTTPMAELIANLQRQNVNLRATRDLLLPRLMSGQLQLSDVEPDPLAAAEAVGARG